MNTIIRWFKIRRLQREIAAKEAKLAEEKAEAEAKAERKKKLGAAVKEITGHMIKAGFNCCGSWSTNANEEYASCNMVVVGPDNKPYTLTVFSAGGYRLESI